MTDLEFDRWVAGKRVALVGPAATTAVLREGGELDRHDVVARVGLYYPPLSGAEVGTRTDVVYMNFWDWTPPGPRHHAMFAHWLEQGTRVQMVFARGARGWPEFVALNRGRLDVRVCERIWKAPAVPLGGIGAAPTKGALAIADLVASAAAEIYVTGFSFEHGYGFRPDYWSPEKASGRERQRFDGAGGRGFLGARQTPHNLRGELAWFTALCAREARLRPDRLLQELMVETNMKTQKIKPS